MMPNKLRRNVTFPSVVVTGANGFIGSTLVNTLRERGMLVSAWIRKGTKRQDYSSSDIMVDELSANSDWSHALAGIDVVVHAAARVHVMHESSNDPLTVFRQVNVAGTLNLAQQAVTAGVRRFIFISSIGVNGSQTFGHPFQSNDKPAPDSLYAQSKYEAEEGLKTIAVASGLELVIIRPPLVYGPNAPGNFGLLTKWISRGLPLPFGAVDKNRRSFIAVDNLVDLIATCIEHPGAANQTFLAADGEDISTTELLRRIALAMDKQAYILPIPPSLLNVVGRLSGKSGTIQKLCGSLQIDILDTQRKLGWSPPISLDEGLKRATTNCARTQSH